MYNFFFGIQQLVLKYWEDGTVLKYVWKYEK